MTITVDRDSGPSGAANRFPQQPQLIGITISSQDVNQLQE